MRVLLLGLLLTGVAMAQGRGGDRWPFFAERYDKDKDGAISAQEYGRGAETFRRLDANNDGQLTQADFAGDSQGRRRGGQGRGARNGNLQRGRLLARGLDRDRSGDISKAEWTKLLKLLPDEGEFAEKRLHEYGISRRTSGRLMTLFDLSGDGKVTRKEVELLHGNFDANQDGVLSKAELSSAARTASKGQRAPDFDLPTLTDTKKTVKLSSFAGKKPVALIFGSYT